MHTKIRLVGISPRLKQRHYEEFRVILETLNHNLNLPQKDMRNVVSALRDSGEVSQYVADLFLINHLHQ